MSHRITITAIADAHLRSLSARERKIVAAAIAVRLVHDPTHCSNSIRKLRPNPCADYELRVGMLRVLYTVVIDAREVVLLLIGRKHGNSLLVDGKVFHGHRSHPPESAAE